MQSSAYQPVWSEKFQVRSFDIGLNAMMRMSSVCGYLQEIAGKHATHLDIGYQVMQESGKVWVLSRLFINIHQLPVWRQDFYAETWPLGIERIFYRRDYRLHDGHNTLITATSYWILLDLNTHKPTIVPVDEGVISANAGNYAMPMPPGGFPNADSEVVETRAVKFSDLDQNRHVNNARYVEWIFDLLDQEVLEKTPPSFFAIEYKHEVKAGDALEMRKVRLVNEKPAFAVEGRLSGSNQVCVRSKIVF